MIHTIFNNRQNYAQLIIVRYTVVYHNLQDGMGRPTFQMNYMCQNRTDRNTINSIYTILY